MNIHGFWLIPAYRAAIFVAQATNTQLTMTQELTILGVLLLTSKGATGVTGSGFIMLAATLSPPWLQPNGKMNWM